MNASLGNSYNNTVESESPDVVQRLDSAAYCQNDLIQTLSFSIMDFYIAPVVFPCKIVMCLGVIDFLVAIWNVS